MSRNPKGDLQTEFFKSIYIKSKDKNEIVTDEDGNRYFVDEYGIYRFIGKVDESIYPTVEHDGRTYWIDENGQEHDYLTDPPTYGNAPPEDEPKTKDVKPKEKNENDNLDIPLEFREINIDNIYGYPLLPNRPLYNSPYLLYKYLNYLHEHHPNIIFTDSQILFDLSGEYNDICYPVWDFYQNKPNWQLEAEKGDNSKSEYIRGRLAAKFDNGIPSLHVHSNLERRAKNLYIYDKDISGLTEDQIIKSPEYQYMASYRYAYYVMGHVWYQEDVISDQFATLKKYPLPNISDAQFKLWSHNILYMPELALSNIFNHIELTLKKMDYNTDANQGPGIIPKLLAYLELGHHFTNYNCTKEIKRSSIKEGDILIYPVFNFKDSSTEPRDGWAQFGDKYYPLNYKARRLVAYVYDVSKNYRDIKTDFFRWEYYEVEKQEANFSLIRPSTWHAQGVIRDPITTEANKLIIKEGLNLDELIQKYNDTEFNPLIKWEEFAVIFGSGIATILSYYITESVIFAIVVGGVTLFTGTAIVLLGNIDNITKTIGDKIASLFKIF